MRSSHLNDRVSVRSLWLPLGLGSAGEEARVGGEQKGRREGKGRGWR